MHINPTTQGGNLTDAEGTRLLETIDLHRSYGVTVALDGPSFTVAASRASRLTVCEALAYL